MGTEPTQPGARAAAALRPPSPPSRAEWGALLAICGVALGLRLWNLLQLEASDPFFARPSVDERMYHEWAQAIAGGDWLGDTVFLNGPLYPYWLAGLYAVFGPSLWVAKLAQGILGTLTCALTWALGRRLFTPPVALGGAALVAVSEMSIFYEGTLVVANWITPLGLLAVWSARRAVERPAPGRWLAAGLWVGAGALARPNLLLLGGLCAGWAWLVLGDRARSSRLGWLAAYALGALLLIAPVTLRNAVVAGDFVPITYSGGMNLYLGNNPDSDGSFRVPRRFARSSADDPWEQREMFQREAESALGRPLRPSEVSRFWSGEALRFVRSEPLAWLHLMWRKLELATNAFEPWNIRSITLAREHSAVLRLPLVVFGLLAPLAFAGIWLTAGRWRELAPLYALLVSVFATMLVFFVLSRYRVPALPALALFASAGVAEVGARWRAARRRPVAEAVRASWAPLLATLLFAGFVNHEARREDLSVAYYNLGNRYRELGDDARAVESYRRALRGKPGYISAHNNLALVYESMPDQVDEARRAWERVRALGAAQGLPGYVERAERHLRALEDRPAS